MPRQLSLDEMRSSARRFQCDPVWWAREVLGEDLWDGQRQILESVRDHRRTAVRTCNAVGKTRVAATTALWYLFAHHGAIVITTAPTWRQVEELLWAELRDRYHHARYELGGQVYAGQPRLVLSELSYARGVSSREPEKLAGYHAPHVLIIVDEASGVDDRVFEALRGVMAGGSAKLLLLGNPTRPLGGFHHAFAAGRSLYHTIRISAFDVPNLAPVRAEYEAATSRGDKLRILRGAPIVRPYLANGVWAADMLEECGEDSAFWRSHVLAEFPSETPDQLIPLHLAEAAAVRWQQTLDELRSKRKLPWWEGRAAPRQAELAVDVARYGNCETVLAARLQEILAPLRAWQGIPTTETAGHTAAWARDLQARVVRVDEPGLGGGVVDILREQALYGLVGFQGGSAPRNAEKFTNLRAEAYWGLHTRFTDGTIQIPDDPRLIAQLTSLRYKMVARGAIQIEAKEDALRRGIVSPDRADAVCMAYAGTGGAQLAGATAGKRTDFKAGMYGGQRDQRQRR